MALQFFDQVIRSTTTAHTAGHDWNADGWRLSWLPGRVLSEDQALTGMLFADAVGDGLEPGDSRWPTLDSWAGELGLSGPEAVVRASTTDSVRARIALAEEAEAGRGAAPEPAGDVMRDAVPMTGPVEAGPASQAWSRRVDDAVFGMDAADPAALDAWMQAHADSNAPEQLEAALITVWETRDDVVEAAEPSGADWDRRLTEHDPAANDDAADRVDAADELSPGQLALIPQDAADLGG